MKVGCLTVCVMSRLHSLLLGVGCFVFFSSEQFKDLFHDLRRRRNVILSFSLTSIFSLESHSSNIACLSRHVQKSGHDVQDLPSTMYSPAPAMACQKPLPLPKAEPRYPFGICTHKAVSSNFNSIAISLLCLNEPHALSSFVTFVSTFFSKPLTFYQCSSAKEHM
jgi:hypothetical protein